MNRIVLFFLLSLCAFTTQAKPFKFVELGAKQSELLGHQRMIYSIAARPTLWKKHHQTIVLSFMNNSVEKGSGSDVEKIDFLFYGGPRFELKNKITSQLHASIHTLIAFGAAAYQRTSTSSSQMRDDFFVGLEPGVRLNWEVSRNVMLHTGISALSGTLGQDVTVDAMPSYEFAFRYQW